jgi:hypothetical protein
MWTRVLDKALRARLKARRKPSKGKSLLSKKRSPSSLGESAAVHHAQTSLLSFSDEAGKGDDDPAEVRTVETLPVVGSDDPASRQEKEARSGGGIPPQ